MDNLPKKLYIRHRFFGPDYYEDENGNKYEIKSSLIGNDQWIEINNEKLYISQDEKTLVTRGFWSEKDEYIKREGLFSTFYEKKSLCLISTICVKEMKFPDDCIELETLRKFRKKYLIDKSVGRNLLLEYERISRKIVKWIDSKEDRQIILTNLYNQLVYPTVDMIKKGYVERPIYFYLEIVNSLMKKMKVTY